ncbi:sulfatase [Chitinophaga horti]|uniref:Sulfatase n=1 Tax=Chitinophaga horti TaxID=2920382 RepID=A0ABY6IUA3_9BACT|nr:sulfatase [Chitinophaga horti]UYQ90953.1 sulfatase [Chitinophaga horti]
MTKVHAVKAAIGLLMLLATAYNNSYAQTKRPNIIIFIADDVSYNDLGCMGHPLIKTPAIDKLAENGLRFTNAYLTTSSCSPSRASILTGRYPHNTGAAELHSDIPAGQVAFPKVLKEHGYYTAQAGKWHLGTSGIKPAGVFLDAFDRVGGSSAEGGGPGGEQLWVDYLQQRPKDKPFFMWFAAQDAHRDWDDAPKPVQYNEGDIKVPANLIDSKATRTDFVRYYEEVSRFDAYVGKVVEELKAQNILDNTFIVVMADNGRPFPRNKTRMYDEGIKTPFVLHWPAGITGVNQSSASLLSVIDIAPTLLELAGIAPVASIQGRSFKKLLTDPKAKFRNYVFAEHNWHSFKAYERMVRTDQYVYIENGLPELSNVGATDIMGGASGKELKKHHQQGTTTPLQSAIFQVPQPRYELYDYVKDKDQLVNLYGRKGYTARQQQLAKVLRTWQTETGDDQPDDLTPDWSDRWSNKAVDQKGTRGTMPGQRLNAAGIHRPGPF